MRVLIAGDRTWHCPALAAIVVRRLVDRHGLGLVLVLGDGPGVDASFAAAARSTGVVAEVHPAARDKPGRRAGPARDAAMVARGADLCLAFHRFILNSTGTKDLARRAAAAGIPTWLVEGEDARPTRIWGDDARLAPRVMPGAKARS